MGGMYSEDVEEEQQFLFGEWFREYLWKMPVLYSAGWLGVPRPW